MYFHPKKMWLTVSIKELKIKIIFHILKNVIFLLKCSKWPTKTKKQNEITVNHYHIFSQRY